MKKYMNVWYNGKDHSQKKKVKILFSANGLFYCCVEVQKIVKNAQKQQKIIHIYWCILEKW